MRSYPHAAIHSYMKSSSFKKNFQRLISVESPGFTTVRNQLRSVNQTCMILLFSICFHVFECTGYLENGVEWIEKIEEPAAGHLKVGA